MPSVTSNGIEFEGGRRQHQSKPCWTGLPTELRLHIFDQVVHECDDITSDFDKAQCASHGSADDVEAHRLSMELSGYGDTITSIKTQLFTMIRLAAIDRMAISEAISLIRSLEPRWIAVKKRLNRMGEPVIKGNFKHIGAKVYFWDGQVEGQPSCLCTDPWCKMRPVREQMARMDRTDSRVRRFVMDCISTEEATEAGATSEAETVGDNS